MKTKGLILVSIIVVCFSFVFVSNATGQEFTYKVQQDRLKGHRDGDLIISTNGVEYRSKKDKDSRVWPYTDIKLFEILSSTRVRIWTYQNRRLGQEESLTFKIVEGAIDQKVSDFLRERIARPLVTSLTKEESESASLAQIPVKHLHNLSGCQGVLKIYSDRLVFEAQDGRDSRSWRWTDIRAVGRPDIDRFEVLTFEPQTGGPKRSYNFILKEPLPEKTYDFMWSRVFRPTPLIRVDEKASGGWD